MGLDNSRRVSDVLCPCRRTIKGCRESIRQVPGRCQGGPERIVGMMRDGDVKRALRQLAFTGVAARRVAHFFGQSYG